MILHTERSNYVPGEIISVVLRKVDHKKGALHLAGTVVNSVVAPSRIGLQHLPMSRIDSGPSASSRTPEWEINRPPSTVHVDNALAVAVHSYDFDCSIPRGRHKSKKARRFGHSLMELLSTDLRFLEAHACLGDFAYQDELFDLAVRYYSVGCAIALWSLGPDWNESLPWHLKGNQGLLRCMLGHAKALVQIGDAAKSISIIEHLLALDPDDGQSARGLYSRIKG